MESLLYTIGGFIGLLAGAELMIRGSVSAAKKSGLSPLVIGLTVVAFGTSSPELLVSLSAALRGSGDIAVGNVVGSNICNIALILGFTALIYPLSVSLQVVKIEIPIAIGATLLLYLALLDSILLRWEGMVLVSLLISYILFTYRFAKREAARKKIENKDAVIKKEMSGILSAAFILLGLLLLAFGSDFFVRGASEIAAAMGVSEAVIALTVVAIGTSLPELITSVVAAIRKETDIAVGNVIGSNIFNIFGILGISSIVEPLRAEGIRQMDLFLMIGISVLLLPFALTGFRLNRYEGAFLLAIYVLFTYSLL